MAKLIFFFMLLLSFQVLASEHQKIDTLGVSPKGQYVALEEYGYDPNHHHYYVIIKVMNVWKKEYVGSPIEVEVPAHRPENLKEARHRARAEAQRELRKFNIAG